MSYSNTATTTETYSVVDIENVMRRVTADFVMIASSTGAVSEQEARDWAHDVEVLAKKGYLRMVDLTLLSYGVEKRATQYTVNTESGELTMSRPGGVLWPKVPGATLRIILSYTKEYDADAKEKIKKQLKYGWTPTNADTLHRSLTVGQGRDYSSNAYGVQRKDFSI